MLTERQDNLLAAVVREFVKTAEPVGSHTLSAKYGFDVSPATIRIEMAVLEDEGFIVQPHTSAGRVPTEAGFRRFVAGMAERTKAKVTSRPKLEALPKEPEEAVKHLAKQLAEQSALAVVVGFKPRHVYYTGLSHLFAQPEFQEYARVARFTEIIDRLDEVMEQVFAKVDGDVTIWLGKENPFGNLCATVITQYQGKHGSGVIGILGPLRMDYERNYALLHLMQQLIREHA